MHKQSLVCDTSLLLYLGHMENEDLLCNSYVADTGSGKRANQNGILHIDTNQL